MLQKRDPCLADNCVMFSSQISSAYHHRRLQELYFFPSQYSFHQIPRKNNTPKRLLVLSDHSGRWEMAQMICQLGASLYLFERPCIPIFSLAWSISLFKQQFLLHVYYYLLHFGMICVYYLLSGSKSGAQYLLSFRVSYTTVALYFVRMFVFVLRFELTIGWASIS